MATTAQLHLARASNPLRPRNGAIPRSFSSQATLGLIRGGGPRLCVPRTVTSRRVAQLVRASKSNVVAEDVDQEVAIAKEDGGGLWSGLPFKGVEAFAAGAGVFLEVAGPAHAAIPEEVEEMMRFSPEAWVNIYITTGIWLVLYFLVIPLVIYNYLRLRWYKRKFAETYFQFLLVFVFFPGMLLLAPFINFRRLPNDGAEEP